MADLFLMGGITAKRARSLYADSQTSDPKEVAELAKVAEGSHGHRDLLRKLKKDKKWPSPFEAHVPVYNRKTCQTEMGRVEIMLPHELVQCMCKWNDHDEEFWKLDNLRHACKQHLQNASMELGMQDDKVLPISFWLDGVPVKYDRSESLEVVTLLFPHLGGEMSSLRLPLTALYKSHMAKDATLDAIMEILTWSLTSLAEGTYPKYGPYGEELKGKRGKLAGQSLQKALLVEVKGDWSAYKSAFRLPGWAEVDSCCFRCHANKTNLNFMDASSTAPWRDLPLSHWELLVRIHGKHGSLPPLYGAPGFKSSVFAIDWLHCCDQGIAADYLGCLMYLILKELRGQEKERLAQLFSHVQAFYQRNNSQSRLDNLTAGMVKKSSTSSPKLRCKAGEARCLIPWIADACRDFLGNSAEHRTATEAGKYLAECYSCQSHEYFNRDKLSSSARKFVILYGSLASLHPDQMVWRCKPKLHIWLHLCEESLDSPALHWVYRDEDFGGTLAHIATRRGGANSPTAVSHMVLQMFYAKHQIPVLHGRE